MSITEAEVLAVLDALHRGEVTIPEEQKREAVEAYCGDVIFDLSNGWRFVVFNDCGEWDYFSAVVAPDGRELSFDDIFGDWPSTPGAMPALVAYQAESAVWGIGS